MGYSDQVECYEKMQADAKRGREVRELQAQVQELRADLELLLSNLRWSNVNAGMAYVLRGVGYSHLLYGPLNRLKEKQAAEAAERGGG